MSVLAYICRYNFEIGTNASVDLNERGNGDRAQIRRIEYKLLF
jgi:hypothetical protein